MSKTYTDKNVYDAVQERIQYIFDEFDSVLISFSCGKDSGVCLNLFYDYAKEHGLLDRMGMYYMDYEADYESTDEYAKRSFEDGFDGIRKYWLCLPISAQCSCSMTGTHWIPWDEDKKDIWVKPMPDNPYVVNEKNAPFYFQKGAYGADTRMQFAKWYSSEYGKTAVIVGIRCDESLSRLSTITSQHRVNMYKGVRYSHRLDDKTYAFYPIYDWTADDVWVANARFGWDYNRAYDLMYYAGVPVSQMRIASPFHGCGQASLKLYRALSPDTWGKMISRVNGANFMCLYGGTVATGYKKVTKPNGFTWQEYADFLLKTLPDDTKKSFLTKIAKIKSDTTDEATWKAVCIAILKNDFSLRYTSLSRSKKDMDKRKKVIEKYKNI